MSSNTIPNANATDPGPAQAPPRTVRARVARFGALLIPSLSDIRHERPIVPPLVLGWIVGLTAAVATRPLLHATAAGQAPGVAGMMEAVLWLAALVAPVLHFLKAGFHTAVGWAATVIANARMSPRLLLSILLYAEVILAFQGVVAALFVHLSSSGMPTSPTDMQAPLSLGALASPTRPVLWSMAQGVSIFHAGWFTFLVVAIRRCADFRWGGAVGLATLFWGLTIGFSALRATILL